MTRGEFQKLAREKFAFLTGFGFTEESVDSDPDSVMFSKEDYVITLKWEDYGTYICGFVEREDSAGSFDMNAFIKLLAPARYREVNPGQFSSDFSREDVVLYLSSTFEMILDEFWDRRNELWSTLVARLEEHRKSGQQNIDS